MPLLRNGMEQQRSAELSAVFEQHGLPYAPITKPEDLFNDVHLATTGGLAAIALRGGRAPGAPLIPITLGGERPNVRLNPPQLGEHTHHLLAELGNTEKQILAMQTSHTAKIFSKN